MVLKGDPGLHKTEISLKAIVKTLQHKRQGIRLENVPTGAKIKEKEEPPAIVKQLLLQFQQVF